MRRAPFSLLALTAVLAAANPALALQPHVRDGWVLGLSYGRPRGEATFASDFEGETEDGASPQIRFGHMLGRHLALGASYAGWMYETGAVPIKYRFSSQTILLAATWFPGRPDGALGGFYVRGGVGLGWAAVTEIELVEGEEQGHGDRETETGLGAELNLGYEFRVVRNVAVGLGIGLNHLAIDGDLYDRSTFYPTTLHLAWYCD